jgi:hypothetical protein
MATPPTKNPTPKARFQESQDNVTRHLKMVDSSEFQRGIDFALLEYQKILALQCTGANEAMSIGVKLCGTLEFIGVLKQLADPPVAQTTPRFQDHLPEMPNPLLQTKD